MFSPESLAKLTAIVRKDSRYDVQGYVFLFEALDLTAKTLGRNPKSRDALARHVTAQELIEGIRQLAIREFGLMAPLVFGRWGIKNTRDFGEMVFNCVEAGLMRKTDTDSISDFDNGFTFEQGFGEVFGEPEQPGATEDDA